MDLFSSLDYERDYNDSSFREVFFTVVIDLNH